MPLYEFGGRRPQIGAGSYVHPAAVLIGGRCFTGPNASLRGDTGTVTAGDGSNVQDNCVLHGRHCILGPNSHLGHGAEVHGVTLGDHVLVGINAIVLDRAVIGAGAVVAPRAAVPARKLLMGVPAAIVSDVSPEREEDAWEDTRG